MSGTNRPAQTYTPIGRRADSLPNGGGVRLHSAKHALAFLEGFNRQMLATRGRHWAVALAIEIGSSGGFAPPRLFSGQQLRRDGPMRALHRRRRAQPMPSEHADENQSDPAGARGPRFTLHFVRAMKTAK